jgi:CRP/FNR family transcriptional regulator, cyclic AMP receptor protein
LSAQDYQPNEKGKARARGSLYILSSNDDRCGLSRLSKIAHKRRLSILFGNIVRMLCGRGHNLGKKQSLGLKLKVMVSSGSVNKSRKFNPNTFLATIGEGRKNLTFAKKQGIFAQGDTADAVFYIQQGKVKLTVVSKTGREATLGMLTDGNFFGEGALAGQALRMGSAAAMTDCEIQRIDKKAMMDALHREPAFSELFVAYLLARNVRYEEDLVDQLFNSSEKRLARILLLLAHFGKEGVPETVIPKISQESLAEMVGTTRSRVSFFMNRFRKLGFVNYSGGPEGGLQVHSSLLGVVLHD